MNRKVIIIGVIAILVIGGIAYGVTKNNNSSNMNMSSSTGYNNSQSSPPPASSSNNQSQNSNSSSNTSSVSIANFAFSPNDITVKKGTTVTWINHDNTAHTVTETDGQTGPNSGDVSPDGKYSFTYNTAGTFHYHCSIHNEMTGVVTVTD